jgi:hypothetical protein
MCEENFCSSCVRKNSANLIIILRCWGFIRRYEIEAVDDVSKNYTIEDFLLTLFI